MKNKLKSFITGLAMMSFILVAIYYLLGMILPAAYLSPAIPYLILFFFLITFLVHYILLKAIGNDGRKFVNAFMLSTLIKFFVYLPLIFIYMYFNRDDLIPFVSGFFILYLCYTIFEVMSILKYQSRP